MMVGKMSFILRLLIFRGELLNFRGVIANYLLFGMILQVGRRDIQMAPSHEFIHLDVVVILYCVPNEVCESPMPGLTWSSCALGGISQSRMFILQVSDQELK